MFKTLVDHLSAPEVDQSVRRFTAAQGGRKSDPSRGRSDQHIRRQSNSELTDPVDEALH
jgi:hypothetical protein